MTRELINFAIVGPRPRSFSRPFAGVAKLLLLTPCYFAVINEHGWNIRRQWGRIRFRWLPRNFQLRCLLPNVSRSGTGRHCATWRSVNRKKNLPLPEEYDQVAWYIREWLTYFLSSHCQTDSLRRNWFSTICEHAYLKQKERIAHKLSFIKKKLQLTENSIKLNIL